MSVESQLEILLRLIDDPEEDVYQAVEEQLLAIGTPALIRCMEVLDTIEDPLVKQRLQSIVSVLRQRPLDQLVALINSHNAASRDIDLEEAVILLDRFNDPTMDEQKVHSYFDDLALRIHEEFIVKTPAMDLTHLMSMHTVLFEQEGFHGAFQDYYDPRNNILSSVIDRKEGSPIALSVVELLVADRVGFDVKGIGLPAHFILYSPQLDVYIDPYHHGRFLSLPDLEPTSEVLQPRSNIYIIMRMMRNLEHAYTRRSAVAESTALRTALSELENSPSKDPS